MKHPWQGIVLATLVLPGSALSSEVTPGSCDAAVGVWDAVAPSTPGRGAVVKRGAKFHSIYLQPAVGSTTAGVEPAAQAGDCTCEGSGGKLRWKCQIQLSLKSSEVGSERVYEWAMKGDNLQAWAVGPDGKRGQPFSMKRLK
jgi:hypothetical protein